MDLRSGALTLIALAAVALPGQTTLQTSSNLVLVPTLVQTPAHELAFSLAAGDFSLTDNGVPQKLTLEDQSARPLALVMLLQTGGAARGQLALYSHLGTMLREILGPAPNQVAIVNFDSEPEAASPFTSSLDEWQDAIDHPDPGDDGAAITDSLAFAMDLLKRAPLNARKAILLVSQSHDNGSKTPVRDVARALGESGTALYTVTFSAEKVTLRQDLAGGGGGTHKPITVAGRTYSAYFELTPAIDLLLGAMQRNGAATLASLSGGESAPFSNRVDLDAALQTVANHIRNSYDLSFVPSAPTPGAHQLAVSLRGHPELEVSARTSYWISDPAPKAH